MNRADFQALAELRIKESEILIDHKCFDGAYYLLGYAIECAFKACITSRTKEFDFPPDRKTIEAIYKHNPTELLKASGLEGKHRDEREANPAFDDNWKIVEVWSEQSRYQIGKSEQEVEDFQAAVVGNEGVFTWLKRYW